MQIPRFSLIMHNPLQLIRLIYLISFDEIISSRTLTCSSVVRLYSCIALTYYSFGDLDGFTLGTYNGADLGSPEESTERTTVGNLEGLILRN